jgi:hypothetical protein
VDPYQREWVESYQRRGWELCKIEGRSLEFLRRSRFGGNVRILSVTLDDSGNVQERERREHTDKNGGLVKYVSRNRFALLGATAGGVVMGWLGVPPIALLLPIVAGSIGNRLDNQRNKHRD